jgi:hypothetical protein
MNGYSVLENNTDKPYIIFLFLSTLLHGFILLLIWMVINIIYHRVIPFIKNVVITSWEESNKEPNKKLGGKVKF